MSQPPESLQLAAIVSSTSDAFFCTRIDGTVLSWNAGAEQLFGYNSSEMIGQPVSKIFPSNRLDEEVEFLAQAVSGHVIERFRAIRKHRDGRLVHVATTAAPIFDEAKQVIGISNLSHDIGYQVALEQHTKQIESLINSSGDAIISENLAGIITSWNPAAEQIFGYTANEIIGLPMHKLLPEDRRREDLSLVKKISQGQKVERYRTVRIRKNGSPVHVSITPSSIKDGAGKIVGVANIARDINHQVQLEYGATHFQTIIDSSDDAIISKALDGTVQSWNKGAELLYGYSASEIIGCSSSVLIPEHCEGEERYLFQQILRGAKLDHFITKRKTKSGNVIDVTITVSPVRDAGGHIIGISSISRELATSTENVANRTELAEHDHLTKVLNRQSFVAQLQRLIDISLPTGKPFTLLYVDIDRFKILNDKMGHEFGDEVLYHVAQTVRNTIHHDDLVCRVGGDEFLVALPGTDVQHAEAISKRLLIALHEPFKVNDITTVISASIGIAVFPLHGTNPKTLITHADHALIEAKNAGRNTSIVFTDSLDTIASRQQIIATDLPKAILADQVFLQYQAIVDLKTESVTKAEALLRWEHPELGMVSPAEFIPIAEDCGCIGDLGDWVFREATAQLKLWQQTFSPDFQISINMSPVQFQTDDHAPSVWNARIAELGLKPGNVVVEITEGSLMKSTKITESKLRGFSGNGFEIAIDDFGTGYSSLAYINKFHLDYLKIDRSFVSKIETHPDQLNICAGIILLAHKLGLKVIAEGIETAEQHRLLSGLGCDYGQGFWYCRPTIALGFQAFMVRAQKNATLKVKEAIPLRAARK